MGHGDRWEVVGNGDARGTLADCLRRIVKSGTAFTGPECQFVWPAKDDRPEEVVVTAPIGVVLQEGPFAFCTISLMKPSADRLTPVTAYPAPREGIARRLFIHEVEEVCLGLEGWVHGATASGVAISFFATDYFMHPERYTKGSEVDVSLSGLAYALRPAVSHRFTLDLPDALRGSLEVEEGRPKDEPLEITTEGAAILLPMQDWEPFDYEFQGPVKQRTRVVHEATPFSYLSVTVARPEDDDIDILVLAGDHIVDGELPDVDSNIAGNMCILGRLTDFDWPSAPETP